MKTFKLSTPASRLTKSKVIYAAKSDQTLRKLFKEVTLIKTSTKALINELTSRDIDFKPNFYEVDGYMLNEVINDKEIVACFTETTGIIYEHKYHRRLCFNCNYN